MHKAWLPELWVLLHLIEQIAYHDKVGAWFEMGYNDRVAAVMHRRLLRDERLGLLRTFFAVVDAECRATLPSIGRWLKELVNASTYRTGVVSFLP